MNALYFDALIYMCDKDEESSGLPDGTNASVHARVHARHWITSP